MHLSHRQLIQSQWRQAMDRRWMRRPVGQPPAAPIRVEATEFAPGSRGWLVRPSTEHRQGNVPLPARRDKMMTKPQTQTQERDHGLHQYALHRCRL